MYNKKNIHTHTLCDINMEHKQVSGSGDYMIMIRQKRRMLFKFKYCTRNNIDP